MMCLQWPLWSMSKSKWAIDPSVQTYIWDRITDCKTMFALCLLSFVVRSFPWTMWFTCRQLCTCLNSTTSLLLSELQCSFCQFSSSTAGSLVKMCPGLLIHYYSSPLDRGFKQLPLDLTSFALICSPSVYHALEDRVVLFSRSVWVCGRPCVCGSDYVLPLEARAEQGQYVYGNPRCVPLWL